MPNWFPEWLYRLTFPPAMYEFGGILLFLGEPPSSLGPCGPGDVDPTPPAQPCASKQGLAYQHIPKRLLQEWACALSQASEIQLNLEQALDCYYLDQ